MDKEKYLNEIKKYISALPQQEVNNTIEYYSEMIDDLVDAGFTENKIIERIGTPKEVAGKVFLANSSKHQEFGDVAYGESRLTIDPQQTIFDKGRNFVKSRSSSFWMWYFIFGIITIPISIVLLCLAFAFVAVLASIAIAGVAIVIAGVAALIFGIVNGFALGLPMLGFTCVAIMFALIGVGLFILWASKFAIRYLRKVFKKNKNNVEKAGA